MANVSPQMRRAYEVLADGEWHDVETVMLEIAKVIPPGVAVRKAEQLRQNSGIGQRPAERQRPRSQDFLVASGKRAMARATLRAPRIEHRDIDGRHEIRLMPPKPNPNSREGRVARGLPVPLTAPPPAPVIDPLSFKPISPQLRRAFELLSDGEWHSRERVLQEMAKLIPRDRALATAERRQRANDNRTPEQRRERRRRQDLGYETRMIAQGARAVSLTTLFSAKRIEMDKRDGDYVVRLRPTPDSRAG